MTEDGDTEEGTGPVGERDGSVTSVTIESDGPGVGVVGPGGARRARVAMVAGAVLLLVALAVPLAMRGSGSVAELQPLGLVPTGPVVESGAVGATSSMAAEEPVEYRVSGDLPDLGPSGTVWQAVDPGVDEERVGSWAAVLGVAGEVELLDPVTPERGWQVDGGRLTVALVPMPEVMFWTRRGVSSAAGGPGCPEPARTVPTVAEGDETAEGAPSVVTGRAPESGDVVTGPPDGDGAVDPSGRYAGAEPSGRGPADLPCGDDTGGETAPCCAPPAVEAEAVARQLMADLGVPGEWAVSSVPGGTRASARADTRSAGAAPLCTQDEDCTVTPGPAPAGVDVITRQVTLRRIVEGQAVAGLEWSVEVGAGGEVVAAAGVLVELERLGGYPLRPVDDSVQALVDGDPSVLTAHLPLGVGTGWIGGAPAAGTEAPSGEDWVAGDAGRPGEGAGGSGPVGEPGVPCRSEPCSSTDVPSSGDEGRCGADRCVEGPVATVPPDVIGTGPVSPPGTVVCVTDPCPGLATSPPGPVSPPGTVVCVTDPCPGPATSPPGPLSTPGAVVCVTDPCPGPDVPSAPPVPPVSCDGSDVDCSDSTPAAPPQPEPEPGSGPGSGAEPELGSPVSRRVVTITGASPGRAAMRGTRTDGTVVLYVVPTYDLEAATVEGTPWPISLVAVHPDLVVAPSTASGPTTTVARRAQPDDPTTTRLDQGLPTAPSATGSTGTTPPDRAPGPPVGSDTPCVSDRPGCAPVTTVPTAGSGPVTTVPASP